MIIKLFFVLSLIALFSVLISDADASHFTIPIPQDDHIPGMRSVIDFYVPRSHSVNTGDVITWTNEDSIPHTVTSGKGTSLVKQLKESKGKSDGLFDSGIINPQESWSFTFSESGQYTYYCTLHPWIERSIIVLESERKVPTPREQFKEGVKPYDIKCNPNYSLVFKSWDLKPACIRSEHTQRLMDFGWASTYDPYPMIVKSSDVIDKAYVTLQEDDKISEVHSEEKWNAGPNMTYLDLSADGSLLLAASSQSDTIYAFDMESGESIKEITVGKTPKGVKIHHTGKIAFVANENSGTISVINLDTLDVVKEIPVGNIPHNIVFHPNGLEAFVTIQGEDEIVIIDVNSLEKTSFIQVGNLPHNLDITPDGNMLFVTNIGSNDVAVIDLNDKEIIKRIPVSQGHHGIDIPPTGNRIFVSGIGDDKISVIDTTSLEVIKQITVGKGPHGLRTDSSGVKLFVGVTHTNEVVVIDVESLEIIDRMNVGNGPFWVAIPGNP
ncbi:MAG: beta-propeller fold lactonase family protein [Nitrosopumilus sp.]|nr:beta-propeller fold lactonase family protein [Nitrosopumilus sp.]MDH3488721.1 beta-propeller fold lactonase family protein [Nitrosopumilus sp.]